MKFRQNINYIDNELVCRRKNVIVIGEYGIGKHGIGEYGIGEYGIGEYGIGEYGIGEYGIGEYGIGEYGIGEYGIGEYGIGEYGSPICDALGSSEARFLWNPAKLFKHYQKSRRQLWQ